MENSENASFEPQSSDDEAQQSTQKAGKFADVLRTGVAMSAKETVDRFGSASAEFIKGYRGVDNQTGQQFAKGLADIAKHKVNADPLEAAKNIKQQAGFAAEVAATSRDNAEAIISGSKLRTVRSDDLPQFGKNHNVVDRVQILDGQIIDGSQAQMKFVGDRNTLFSRIAREDGKFERYRGIKLELPSEQFADAKEYCQEQADKLRANAQQAEQHGKPDVAAKLRREAANYEELGENVRDSGLTTEQAIKYRQNPAIETIRDIAQTSHRAGMEGAKIGAVIGGSVSIIKNVFAVAQNQMEWGEAALEVGQDALKSSAIGYGTAFVGSAVKGVMEQSGREGIRVLANTSAPTLVVSVCLSLGSSVKRYVCGEIGEAEFLIEVGEKGAGMLSSGMFAALGQVAIPIPVVGAAIGGMVGYTLSSIFYQSALDAAKGAELSRENLNRVRVIEAEARSHIAREQAALDAFMGREIPQLHEETRALFLVVDTVGDGGVDGLAAAVNRYATLLGKQLQFGSKTEFDAFMASDAPLRL